MVSFLYSFFLLPIVLNAGSIDDIYDDIDYQESGNYYDHFVDAWSSYYEYLADALNQQLVNQSTNLLVSLIHIHAYSGITVQRSGGIRL